jgi:hypothetical protein
MDISNDREDVDGVAKLLASRAVFEEGTDLVVWLKCINKRGLEVFGCDWTVMILPSDIDEPHTRDKFVRSLMRAEANIVNWLRLC